MFWSLRLIGIREFPLIFHIFRAWSHRIIINGYRKSHSVFDIARNIWIIPIVSLILMSIFTLIWSYLLVAIFIWIHKPMLSHGLRWISIKYWILWSNLTFRCPLNHYMPLRCVIVDNLSERVFHTYRELRSRRIETAIVFLHEIVCLVVSMGPRHELLIHNSLVVVIIKH
jgi:hypothetical protein